MRDMAEMLSELRVADASGRSRSTRPSSRRTSLAGDGRWSAGGAGSWVPV